jgi:hypothetical protein
MRSLPDGADVAMTETQILSSSTHWYACGAVTVGASAGCKKQQ